MTTLRHVTLSDGTPATVRLNERLRTQYYPDVPHCITCDTTDQGNLCTRLIQCEYPQRGKQGGMCRQYVCMHCAVIDTQQRLLCPTHEEA